MIGSRVALNIPYTWSRMRATHEGDRFTYVSRRRWPAPRGLRSRVEVEVLPGTVEDDPLADFLTARWGLFTSHVGRCWFLPNEHDPWPLRRIRVIDVDDELVAAAGFPGLSHRTPDSALFSAGVRTVFGGPQRVDIA